MAEQFRLNNIHGDDTVVDWQVPNMFGQTGYNVTAIGEIADPYEGDPSKNITSIPSPFARIDLVKTAFREVVASRNLDGRTIYHKMVSQTLDVAEIFFNFDNLKNKFEVIVWDKDKELLDTNGNPSKFATTNPLGKTLRVYLKSDAMPDATGNEPYNFSKMKRIYLLNYIGKGKRELKIVGATSPATLFFSSANDWANELNSVTFGTIHPFSNTFVPLYERDFEFQKYLNAFEKVYGTNFMADFPEVAEYLTMNYNQLPIDKRDVIDNFVADPNCLASYEKLTIVGATGTDILEILGKAFHKKPTHKNWESDFEIKSTIYSGDKTPLVLPVEAGSIYEHLQYTTASFGNTNKAPYFDSKPLDSRRLPLVGDLYPYLTISDFLTDTIVCMPYEIDSDNFFDGNINYTNGNSYLLPLKDTFFRFFSVKDLTEMTMNDNKEMFELEDGITGITVVLRIPIKNGYIKYNRTYFKAGADANETKSTNDGVLLCNENNKIGKIGLGIMPLIRFHESVKKHYRIAMFDKGRENAVLTCIEGNKTVEAKQVVRAKKDLAGRGCSHESYIVEDNFDRILVEMGNVASGYIVPRFKIKEGNAQFTFAVDFGTTNTHIEYCTNTNTNTSPVAFDIKAIERQLHKLHKLYSDPDIRMGFVQEFIPDTIGDNDVYSFPMRTVFADHKNIKFDQNPMPLADGNIPFLYEKDFTPTWNTVHTELKWDSGKDDKEKRKYDRLLEMNLETIFILMRNKVALNEGDLAATKVVWFYPACMTEVKVNQFKLNWIKAYEKYFGQNTNMVISISESKAPYIHFIENQDAAPEIVTIDIGGGTTDVFIVEREEDKMLLSFRFASNAIFGDGHNSNPSRNGFVLKYKKTFEDVLKNNNLQELFQALNQIEKQDKSSDIIAFLFSLIGDKVKNNPELNFLQILMKDDRMRYVFIIFYASILYFIAKSMKAKGLMKPITLAFSGNGAHSLRIVSNSEKDGDTEKFPMMERFAKLIFDGVYGDTTGTIKVMMEKNPKTATCQGGIKRPQSQEYGTIDNIRTILVGNDFDNFSDKKLTYADIKPDIQDAVVKSVKNFLKFLFDLHIKNNDFLSSKLGASSAIFNQVKEFCLGETGEQLLSVSMFKGLKNKRKEVNDDTKLEETLFFYPLVGMLHDLAFRISQM